MSIAAKTKLNGTTREPLPQLLDPELRKGRIVCDARGMPLIRHGRGTVVYGFTSGDGRAQAMRILPASPDSLLTRYEVNGDYLQRHHIPALASFRCYASAARLDNVAQAATAIVMDWIAGESLDAWIAKQVRLGATASLSHVAGLWHEVVKNLAQHGIVHGDLEPGNILVEPSGRITLVDYDGLAVPTLMGQPSPEVGTPPYQHPGRHAHTPMFAGLDNFAALMIYVELRALAAEPDLWRRHRPSEPCGRLLFDVSDFSSFGDNALFNDLFASPDKEVRDLAHYLRKLWHGDLHDVPPIEEVLLWRHSLEHLLDDHDFDRAAQLVGRMGSQERIDWRMLPAIDNAQRRAACRSALENALKSADVAEVERMYDAQLLADYPNAAPLVERATRMLAAARALRSVEAAVAERRWSEFARLWLEHATLLESMPAARRYRQYFDAMQAAERLEALLDDPASDEQTVLTQWQAIFSGDEPPWAERLQAARDKRQQRQSLFAEISSLIAAASQTPTFDGDRLLRRLWKSAQQLGETRLQPLHGHYVLAKQRMKRLRWLNSLVRSPSLVSEQQVAACQRYLPVNYHARLPKRIQLAQQRLEALRVLEMAAIEPVSERRLLAAWSAVVAAKGQTFVSQDRNERIALAQRRLSLIEAIEQLDRLNPKERDDRIIEMWDAQLLTSCSDAKVVEPLWNDACARKAAITRLTEALEAGDPDHTVSARNDPCLANYRLPNDLQSLLAAHDEQLRQARLERRHALVQAILDHDGSRFRDLFDRILVADICSRMPQHQRMVADWVEREILPLGKSGLALKTGDGLRWTRSDVCQARWTWPHSTVAAHCLLTISRETPKQHAIPSEMTLLHSMVVERGSSAFAPTVEFLIDPGYRGASVFIWAIIDLGYQTFYSDPLSLGELPSPDSS